MVLEESPIVENFNRNITFSKLTWLDNEEFLNCKQSSKPIYPNMECNHSTNIYYIGKNILHLTNNAKNVFIGYVNNNNELKIGTNDSKVIITQNYYVLKIDDCNSYGWVKANPNSIPKYALRACLNYNQFEHFYVGRNIVNSQSQDNNVYVGTVYRSDDCLYVCDVKNELVKHDKFEILVMKPSPTTLKQLSRSCIRQILNDDNCKISKLINFIPNTLVSYLKYRSYLSNNECLLKNEKLVSNNGLHELILTSNSKLVYKDNSTKNRILYDFVESIWVKKYYTVINRYDNAFVYFLYLLNNDDYEKTSDNIDGIVKLELTNNAQLVLHQGNTTFKKYFIHE